MSTIPPATTVGELAALVGGRLLQGEAATPITGPNSLGNAVVGEVTFLGNSRYAKTLKDSKAAAVLVPPDFTASAESMPAHGVALIGVENPTMAFSKVIKFFAPPPREIKLGVHPAAYVAATAVLNRDKVFIGPGAVVDDGAEIGDGTIVHAGVLIGANAKIGPGCLLHPGCVVNERCVLGARVIIQSGAVIGSDGFGYELVKGRHVKIEQVGIVQLDDDVEVGACSTIDRARFGRTWIGAGTKIDNQVQVAHNVVTGQHCILVAQVGISGSTRLGNYVVMAGQVGVGGHLNIGDQVTLLARSGVTKDIKDPGHYTGFPAKPLMEGRRLLAAPGMVPDLIARVRELERKVAELAGKA